VSAGEHSPLDQFIVSPIVQLPPLFSIDTSLTNSALFMLISVLVAVLFFSFAMRKRAAIPGRTQSLAEIIVQFVQGIVEENVGHDGKKYFPFILTLFLFILFVNLLGLLPASFTPTSHIAVTAILGFGVFIFVTLLGFAKHGIGYLGLFWMKDAPLILRPIIAVIEVISYFVRPVSHSIRLAGNIMAGHAVIKVFAAFAPMILISAIGVLVTPVSVLAIVAIYALEVLVAFIQAYVFTILTCVYLKDALHPGH
jgi:F-type H+-transporting ATPase subunit a